MLLEEIEVRERIESPLNLLNRLKSLSNNGALQIPSVPPAADRVIEDIDEKLAMGGLKSKAAGIMSAAMTELQQRLPEVQRPEKLAAIAEQMSRVINNSQTKNDNGVHVGQIVVYAPQIMTEDRFEVIELVEA